MHEEHEFKIEGHLYSQCLSPEKTATTMTIISHHNEAVIALCRSSLTQLHENAIVQEIKESDIEKNNISFRWLQSIVNTKASTNNNSS
jgi:hypothetical protein